MGMKWVSCFILISRAFTALQKGPIWSQILPFYFPTDYQYECSKEYKRNGLQSPSALHLLSLHYSTSIWLYQWANTLCTGSRARSILLFNAWMGIVWVLLSSLGCDSYLSSPPSNTECLSPSYWTVSKYDWSWSSSSIKIDRCRYLMCRNHSQ